MWHAIGRGIVHFFASAGIVMLGFFVLRYIQKVKKWPWLPAEFRAQIVFAAVCVFAGSALREAFDVAAGQSAWKALSDYISWALGVGVSAWGLWRVRNS